MKKGVIRMSEKLKYRHKLQELFKTKLQEYSHKTGKSKLNPIDYVTCWNLIGNDLNEMIDETTNNIKDMLKSYNKECALGFGDMKNLSYILEITDKINMLKASRNGQEIILKIK